MRYLLIFFLFFSAFADSPGLNFGRSYDELREVEAKSTKIADHLVQCTVGIQPTGIPGMGSGVIIDKSGLILTAAHVTQKPGVKLKIYMSDGTVYEGISLGLDHSTDAGMAKITEPGEFPFTPMAQASSFKVKDWVIATGHPGGVMLNRKPPLRLGRILKAGTAGGFSDPLTTGCTVISGDSGGPLFNLDGEVIGINSNINIPYLINNHVPIDVFHRLREFFLESKITNAKFDPTGASHHPLVKKFKEQMQKAAKQGDKEAQEMLSKKKLKVDEKEMTRLLGKWTADLTAKKPFLGISLNLLTEDVARISEVEADSPANKAKLKKGDLIKVVNKVNIQSVHDFINLLQSYRPGDILKLTIKRHSEMMEISCKLTGRPERHIPSGGFHMLRDRAAVSMSVFDNSRVDKKYLKSLSAFGSIYNESVVKITSSGKFAALGTVISADGTIVSKSSLIPEDEIACEYKGKTYQCKIAGRDEGYDLAVIKIQEVIEMTPVNWAEQNISLGGILLTPDNKGDIVSVGTVSLLPRRVTKYGLGIGNKSGDLPVTLGLMLDDSFGTLEINRVAPGSPAAAAGIVEGEILTEIEGMLISRQSQLIDFLKGKKPGDKVKVTLAAGKEKRTVDLMLGEPAGSNTKPTGQDKNRDRQLHNLSRRGGKISKRRSEFPRVFRHDSIIQPKHCGGPLLNLDGKAVGINIARAGRCKSYAIAKKELLSVINKIMEKK